MSTAQAERAICQLYESDSLRSELRDDEAGLLLMWGEARLNELAARDLPDDRFDHLAEKLRTLLTNVNLCVGKRKTSPSQHLSLMAGIGSAADAAGFVLTPDDQTTFLRQQAALTNHDAISELLGLLKIAAVLPAPHPPEAAPEPVEVSAQAAAEPAPVVPDAAPDTSANASAVGPAPSAPDADHPLQPETLPEAFQSPAPVEPTSPPRPEELPEMHQPQPQENHNDE